MSFKEQLMRDLDNVFLNLDEFAETCRVEGKEISAVLDKDDFTKMKQGQILGLVRADILLFAKAEDLPTEKNPGSLLNVNGREYIVESWGTDTGLSEIALLQNRTM
jgi:hypothetical protein